MQSIKLEMSIQSDSFKQVRKKWKIFWRSLRLACFLVIFLKLITAIIFHTVEVFRLGLLLLNLIAYYISFCSSSRAFCPQLLKLSSSISIFWGAIFKFVRTFVLRILKSIWYALCLNHFVFSLAPFLAWMQLCHLLLFEVLVIRHLILL